MHTCLAGYRFLRFKAGFATKEQQWEKLNGDIETGADGMLDDISEEQRNAKPPAMMRASTKSSRKADSQSKATGKKCKAPKKLKPKPKAKSKKMSPQRSSDME